MDEMSLCPHLLPANYARHAYMSQRLSGSGIVMDVLLTILDTALRRLLAVTSGLCFASRLWRLHLGSGLPDAWLSQLPFQHQKLCFRTPVQDHLADVRDLEEYSPDRYNDRSCGAYSLSMAPRDRSALCASHTVDMREFASFCSAFVPVVFVEGFGVREAREAREARCVVCKVTD
jgi:hypothetical protein